MAAPKLNMECAIGFNGTIRDGLILRPDGYLIYPLGSTIVVKDINRNTQAFMQGHSDEVTCLAISPDGTRVASGQKSKLGYADVILWDLDEVISNANTSDEAGELLHRLQLHKGMVRDLAFSDDNKFLASLGGQDDNSLVVWNVEKGEALCGSPAAQDSAHAVEWMSCMDDGSDYQLTTCGNMHLKLWHLSPSNRKLQGVHAKVGNLQRVFKSLTMGPDRMSIYAGTETGDVVEFNLDRNGVPVLGRMPKDAPKTKKGDSLPGRVGKGAKCIRAIPHPLNGADTILLVGAGDGTLNIMLDAEGGQDIRCIAKVPLMGSVTSVALFPVSDREEVVSCFVYTGASNMYKVDIEFLSAKKVDFKVSLRGTCHNAAINDIVFPKECSELFVTCSDNDIRVWNARSRQELLRIQVPNLTCNCVAVTPNGGSILSGWSDGKIRAFYPESGNLKFVITDAHNESCTALAVCNDDDNLPPWRVVSGGQDGRVRVWNIHRKSQELVASLKEHRNAVSSVRVTSDNEKAVTSSHDGSCLVWSLTSYHRLAAVFAPCKFESILFHPDESQMLTAGNDGKIVYWDAVNADAIRVLDDNSKALMCMDIEPDGIVFAAGGADKEVRVYDYDEGEITHRGIGHSGNIKAVKISPDQQTIISVGAEGSIFCWTMPESGAVDYIEQGRAPEANMEAES